MGSPSEKGRKRVEGSGGDDNDFGGCKKHRRSLSPLQHKIAGTSTQARVGRVELLLGDTEVKRVHILCELEVDEAPARRSG